jgi:hypothetical protein
MYKEYSMAPKTQAKAAPAKAAPAKAAPAKAAPAKTKEETKAVAVKEKTTKSVSTASAADLARMAMAAGEADRVTRASDGATFSYISLAKDKSKALDEDEPEFFIKGLTLKEFYIQSTKERFGKILDVVPLMFVTVYAEYDGPGNLAKFCGVWHRDDALKLPTVPGSNFNRLLPEGHEARPQKWVFLYVVGHDDIVNAVLTYKSTGNKIAKSWIKDLEGRQLSSCQTVYSLEAEKQKNDRGQTWLDVRPTFKGVVYTLDGDQMTAEEDFAEEVLKRTLALNQAYNQGLLIQRKSVESVMRSASLADDDDDGDGEGDDDEALF